MAKSSDPEKLAQKRRDRKRRIVAYGSIGALLVGFYYYQPNRIDFIPRRLPNPNPRIDPDSKKLFQRGTRVAIVTAHPDDAEFYLGGTLSQLAKAGADITLIVCTNGDKSFYPWEDGEKLGRIRQGEQRGAFERWHGLKAGLSGISRRQTPSKRRCQGPHPGRATACETGLHPRIRS